MSRRSQAMRLVDLVLEERVAGRIELGRDGDTAYIRIQRDEHWEAYSLPSVTVSRYLRLAALRELEAAPPSATIDTATAALAAIALSEGVERPTSVRVAASGGNIYLDLCDPDWRVVEIDASGWRLTQDAPVVFLRRAGMLPLPEPQHEAGPAGLGELRRLANLPDSAGWCLAKAWLLSCFMPAGTLPVLVLEGEAGSGKTSLARMLRGLVDPNIAPLRGEPVGVRDLMIASENSHIVSLENVSVLPGWLSDAVCGLASGRGFATRQLYTDRDEAIFYARRSVILTAIETVARRGDLADRCCHISLPSITDEARLDERSIDAAYEDARPRILGALLDAVSHALAHEQEVVLERAPRLADWARFVTAAEAALGLRPGEYMETFLGARADSSGDVLAAAVAGEALVSIARAGWEGTAAELLQRLEPWAGARPSREWPQTPIAAGNLVRRLAPALRAEGYTVEFSRRPGGNRNRTIRLSMQSAARQPVP